MKLVNKMKVPSSKGELRPLSSTTLRKISQDAITLIDIRPRPEYDSSHITSAVNIHCSPLLIRRFQRGNKPIENLFLPEDVRRKLQRDPCQIVVLYDNESNEENISKEIIQMASVLQHGKRSSRSIFYIDGGLNAFSKDFPQFCESSQLNLLTDWKTSDVIRDPTDHMLFNPMENEPTRLLPHLFIGSAQHAANKEVLQRLGITAILNVSKTCRNNFEEQFTYKTIPVDDSFNEDIGSYFAETSLFIDSIRQQNGKVLVHCKAGVSRSVTICLAYLITTYKLSFDDAYEFIKKKKDHISPNFSFLGQLLRLEKDSNIARSGKLEIAATPMFGNEIPSSPRLPLESLPQNSPLPQRLTFTYPPLAGASCAATMCLGNSIGTNSPKLLPTPT